MAGLRERNEGVNSEVVTNLYPWLLTGRRKQHKSFLRNGLRGCSLTDRKGCINGGLARDTNQGVISQVARVYVVFVTSYKIQEVTRQIFTVEWGEGCNLTDEKGCISGVLARDRNQDEYIVSVTSYKIEEIAQQLLTEEWGEGCSLTDRRACISGGL